jgi:hypothetical protein
MARELPDLVDALCPALGEITGIDLSEPMLKIARNRVETDKLGNVEDLANILRFRCSDGDESTISNHTRRLQASLLESLEDGIHRRFFLIRNRYRILPLSWIQAC